MTFTDPIVGGESKLIRSAIQSPNYVTGVSGWTINRDGSYEFGPGGTFRGDITVLAADGSYVKILPTDGGKILIKPEDAPGVVYFDDASIFAGYASNAGGFTWITFDSAAINDNGNIPAAAQIFMSSALGDGTARAGYTETGPTFKFNGSATFQGELIVNEALHIGGNASDIGRGCFTGVSAAANSAAIPNGFTTVSSTPAEDWPANRAYRAVFGGRYQTSVANMAPNTAVSSNIGTTLAQFGKTPCTTASAHPIGVGQDVFITGATVLNRSLNWRLSSDTVGQTVTVLGPRWMKIYDIGPASDYPDAVVLV